MPAKKKVLVCQSVETGALRAGVRRELILRVCVPGSLWKLNKESLVESEEAMIRSREAFMVLTASEARVCHW